MFKSISLRSYIIVAVMCPLLMPTVTRSESFEILFLFEGLEQTEKSDLLALIDGGYEAGLEVGMKGRILIKKGKRRGRKRAGQYAEIIVQDVSRFESSVLIQGVEAHRIKSKHTVDIEIPELSGAELRQIAYSYYANGSYGIARYYYGRALWGGVREDSLELRECYWECYDEVAKEKVRPLTEEESQAELDRWPAYWALAWMYVGRREFKRAAEYNDRILRLSVHEGEAEELACQLEKLSSEDLSVKDSLRSSGGPPASRFHPEMIEAAVFDYPPLARAAGITGRVWVKSLVSETGSVIGSCVGESSGHLILDIAAVEAAYDCKFKPGLQDGKPVACWVLYKVEFVLD